jgi:RNA-binding protein YlmH
VHMWFCWTSGDAKNAINGGSVRVNWEVINDSQYLIQPEWENFILIQMGKKKAKRVFL